MTNKFDKSDEKLREQYEEAFFQELMEGYDEYQGEKLRREAEAENSEGPSAELIAQMEAKIAKEINRQKRMKTVPKLRRFGKYVAIFFVAIAAVFSVSFVTVDAFRNSILNYFFEDQGESTRHKFQQEQDGIYLPSYIPENLYVSLYSDDDFPVQILLQSSNEEDYAHILIFHQESEVYSNTEDAVELEYININGTDGEYCENDGYASLIWSNKECTRIAHLTSNLSKSEIINIAQSIKL